MPQFGDQKTLSVASPVGPSRVAKIGILIVAYNAVTTLVKVLQRIPADVWGNVSEVVVFDDASQDFTYELAVGYKAVADLSKLHIIRNQNNLGYGGNQKAGYRYFIEHGFDVVVLLHGDGQYAPEVLSTLYLPIVNGEAEAVLGSRMMRTYGGPLKGGMPLYKYVGNRILTSFENAALGLHLSEFHSGYRAYDLHALRRIQFSRMTDDFHFDTEILIKLHHLNFRIKEVPIPTYYGQEICYVNGMKYARDVVRAVVRYRRTTRSVRCYNEFEEFWVHYAVKQTPYSSHYYLRRFAGSGERILDIGCGEGWLAAELAQKGNRVTGIDRIPQPTHIGKMQRYFQCDMISGIDSVIDALRGQSFEEILLLDVLEHLPQPEHILRSCSVVLAPRGQVLVSVPNVANVTVRLMLLAGRFNYTDRGILDKTHLRFFTRKTARHLLEESGYEVVREMTTNVPIEFIFATRPDNKWILILHHLLAAATRLFPNLLGYQCMFVARQKTRS